MDKNITTQQSESYICILTYLKVFILFFDIILLNLLIVGYELLPNYLSLDTLSINCKSRLTETVRHSTCDFEPLSSDAISLLSRACSLSVGLSVSA